MMENLGYLLIILRRRLSTVIRLYTWPMLTSICGCFGPPEVERETYHLDVPSWLAEEEFDSRIFAYSYHFVEGGQASPSYAGPATCVATSSPCQIPYQGSDCRPGIVFSILPARPWNDFLLDIYVGSINESGVYETAYSVKGCEDSCVTGVETPPWVLLWRNSNGAMTSGNTCKLEVVNLLETPMQSICLRRQSCAVGSLPPLATDLFQLEFVACCKVGPWFQP